MASTLKLPEPGDLITAQDMRDLITLVMNLEVRVTDLEQNAPSVENLVVIKGLEWQTDDLQIGDELKITGVNLGTEMESHVEFGTLATVTDYKPGSDDSLIIISVPDMSFTGESKIMSLTVVRPGFVSDSRQVTIFKPKAPTIPDGTIKFSVELAPFTPSLFSTATVEVTIQVEKLNMDTTFDVGAKATLKGNVLETVIFDSDGKKIEQLLLKKTDSGYEAKVSVKVKIEVVSPLPPLKGTFEFTLTTLNNPDFAPTTGVLKFGQG